MKVDQAPITPAFRSTRASLGYCILTLGLVFLPLILSVAAPPPSLLSRYATVRGSAGDFSFNYNEIACRKADIDVLIVGASLVQHGIHAPTIRDALTAVSHVPKVVITLGHSWHGDDVNYFMLRDLLQRRRVHLVIMQLPPVEGEGHFSDWPHATSINWFTLADWNVVAPLPLTKQVSLYTLAIVGAPRKLLSLIRADRVGQLGAESVEASLGGKYVEQCEDAPFEKYSPPPRAFHYRDLLYSSAPDKFKFLNQPVSPYPTYFSERTIELLKQYRIPVLIVHMPTKRHATAATVNERLCWPVLYRGSSLDVAGVPAATLFAGLTDAQISKLYSDDIHMNANGCRYFTKAILDSVVHAYH